ncbi:MAG: hypothetical protein HKO48_02680 [Nitrosopumilus sp.]|nr:hypothetical protein [Nitrosopumilus sp.]NNL36992.1 hypothetical protein [Nitrosopumilus sp.]NNM36002.1 hypothetical protein [Nitrosopumilus sp.]
MPDYFKSLTVLEEFDSHKIVLENISFLGQSLDVKTKHVVLPPNTHEVYILSGPLKNTSFIEKYVPSSLGTDITIIVDLQINGFLKFIPFLRQILIRKMGNVMNEFVKCAELYSRNLSAKE